MQIEIEELIEVLDSIFNKARKIGLILNEELAIIAIKSHLEDLKEDKRHAQ